MYQPSQGLSTKLSVRFQFGKSYFHILLTDLIDVGLRNAYFIFLFTEEPAPANNKHNKKELSKSVQSFSRDAVTKENSDGNY